MATYIALLRKEKNSAFGVDFPDFTGCITAGDSLEEARRRAPQALMLHIQGTKEDGEAIPPPSTLDAIMADPANQYATAFLVEVAEEPAKAVRINITLPQGELIRIDQYAKQARLSRSAFLLWAVQKVMKKSNPA